MPAFALLAARYLDERYSPDVVAKQIGVPATTIRRIAAELAYTAFETPVVIDRPWTDWAGRRHDTHDRPSDQHSCHARDFGAFERLPHLPGAARVAGAVGRDRYARGVPL